MRHSGYWFSGVSTALEKCTQNGPLTDICDKESEGKYYLVLRCKFRHACIKVMSGNSVETSCPCKQLSVQSYGYDDVYL